MRPHLLVTQLRFTRSELVRALEGVSEEDGVKRILPMNCISWVVGHVANQEQYLWVILGQQKIAVPGLNDLVGYGMPASTPPLAEMWAAWRKITAEADIFLDTLTPESMQGTFLREGKPLWETIGTNLLRNIDHTWYHIGEASAIRQMLGHTDLPQFVGDMSAALYHPET